MIFKQRKVEEKPLEFFKDKYYIAPNLTVHYFKNWDDETRLINWASGLDCQKAYSLGNCFNTVDDANKVIMKIIMKFNIDLMSQTYRITIPEGMGMSYINSDLSINVLSYNDDNSSVYSIYSTLYKINELHLIGNFFKTQTCAHAMQKELIKIFKYAKSSRNTNIIINFVRKIFNSLSLKLPR